MPLCVPRSYLCFESSKSGSSKRNKVIKLVDITDIQKVSVACGVRLGARHVCGGRVQTPDVGAPSRDSPAPISVPGPRASPPTAPWAGARARSDHSTAGPSSVRPRASGQVQHSFVCGRGRAACPAVPGAEPVLAPRGGWEARALRVSRPVGSAEQEALGAGGRQRPARRPR